MRSISSDWHRYVHFRSLTAGAALIQDLIKFNLDFPTGQIGSKIEAETAEARIKCFVSDTQVIQIIFYLR